MFFSVFLLALFRGFKPGFCAAMALLPFGALAVLTVGNSNLLVLHAAFLVLLGLSLARHYISPKAYLMPKLETSAFIIVVVTLYALATSQIFPRIFEGDIMVFSLDGSIVGQRLSPLFPSQISSLRPTSGNISQSFYFALSTLVFIFALRQARFRGADLLDRSLFFAASANAVIGLLDFLSLDFILSIVKTAQYSIILDAKVAGVSRVVGAFTEASSMGSFSAIMFSYMFMRYLDTGNRLALLLAGSNLLWGVLALSSTGFVALAAAALAISWRSGSRHLTGKFTSKAGTRVLAVGLAIVFFLLFATLVTDAENVAFIYINELILQKGSSLSAVERGAWAQRGLEIGFETFGLGAGLGSTRSNGIFSVLISNIGVPGLIGYAAFIWFVIRSSNAVFISAVHKNYYNAAIVGIFTLLAGKMVSGTTAEPGILFMVLSAIAVSARTPNYIRWTRPRTA